MLSDWMGMHLCQRNPVTLLTPSLLFSLHSLFVSMNSMREIILYVLFPDLMSIPIQPTLPSPLLQTHGHQSTPWTQVSLPHSPEKSAPMLCTTSAFSYFTAKLHNVVGKTTSSADYASVCVCPLISPSEQSFHMSWWAFSPILQLFLSPTILFNVPDIPLSPSFSMGSFAFRHTHTRPKKVEKLKSRCT